MVSNQTAVKVISLLILLILIMMVYFHREIADWNDHGFAATPILKLHLLKGGMEDEKLAIGAVTKESETITSPILLWWTPFTGEEGRLKHCGSSFCFFTNNRKYQDYPRLKAFLYYGTDFKYGDLPVPRQRHHEWALFHEESPQNNYIFSHASIVEVFNHTATFRRESDLPLTLQYLQDTRDLESLEYFVDIKEKNRLSVDGSMALINYVQSDCGAPSDRDHFVKMLQRHIEVDALGKCEHNKELPQHLRDPIQGMDHKDFYKIIARYKFTITFENAVCSDYVTEKFWRPFRVGSVPIVFGSPKIRDLLPSPKSAILVSDYKNIEDLASYLKFLDSNDVEYNKYLSYKHDGVNNLYLKSVLDSRSWGINGIPGKPNMVDAFECMICERVNENLKRERSGMEPIQHRALGGHYNCPKPLTFADEPRGNLQRVDNKWSRAEWTLYSYVAKALRIFLDRDLYFSGKQVEILASALQMRHHPI